MQNPKIQPIKIHTENDSKKAISAEFPPKSTLREKAEEILERQEPEPLSILAPRSRELLGLSEAETQRLIHDLEVHQIELEMQNNELIVVKEQLELSVEKYTELYDFSPAGYFTLNKDGEVLELNLYGSKMLGKERSKLINSRFGFFISVESKLEFTSFLESLFTFYTKASCEITLNPEGDSHPIHLHLSGTITNGDDKCLIAATDITERKRVEEQLELKNKELQKANIDKDKFFSIIAHDLRGPLSGILGLTDLMAQNLTDMDMEEIKKIVLVIKKSATNVNYLLGNLLEWARLQRGLIPFLPRTFVLRPRIVDSLGFIIEAANEKKIEISFEIPGDLEIYADTNILESVLRNLVSNAVKFTPSGGSITVSATRCADQSIEISVKDTGIGMDKTIIDNLFRLDSNNGRKGTAGELSTGLGLIICKDLIEKHKGKIRVESEVSNGSIVHFTLPAQKL